MNKYLGIIKRRYGNMVLVFGSNTQGRHGKGAAKLAINQFGAIYGQAKGRQGNSYAIITKDLTKKIHPSIPKNYIREQIIDLYKHALDNLHEEFHVVYSGTGQNLNSYSPEEMAEMFYMKNIPQNIYFEEEFYKLVENVPSININDF